MAREDDEQPGFAFKKLLGAENYKEWARQMRYSLESARLWMYTLSVTKNPKPAPIILKKEDELDDAKVERQEKRMDKILAWTRSNSKCKGYIGRMCAPHIQQEIQAVKTDWLAKDLWEWLKQRYTLQNTASKWATIVSMDDLSYANCKNMAEYRSKYYALKASIKEQSITIEDALKIRMLNNLSSAFKTYLTVVNDWIRKDKKLEEDETLFKAIEEEKTRIVAKQKASANFVTTKSHYSQPQEGGKEGQIEWPMCRKCACKYPSDRVCRHAEDECYKCHRKGHISWFHDLYITLTKRPGPEENDKPAPVSEIPKVNQMYTEVTC